VDDAAVDHDRQLGAGGVRRGQESLRVGRALLVELVRLGDAGEEVA
jgi:hypothetical protein